MTKTEFEPEPPSLDQRQLEQSTYQLGRLHGISGLEIVVSPGEGASCAKLDTGLRITIDPKQIMEGAGRNITSAEAGHISPEITALFIIAHELGHAKDYLDPTYLAPVINTPSGEFFDYLIDDTVIDKRNRRIPLFDANADAIYAHQIPSDLTKFPRHVQLMFGIRISQVVKDPQLEMAPEVQNILTDLTNYKKAGDVFDIPAVLAYPRTSLAERRRIASIFILPYYEAFLEQDIKEQQNAEDDTSEAEDDDFEAIYDQYKKTVHGQLSGQELNLVDQIAEVLKEAAKDRESKDSAKVKDQPDNDEDGSEDDKQLEAQPSDLPGVIAAEMNLSQGDAARYVDSLDKWTPTIKELADIFKQLAAPTNTPLSPRYRRGAHTEGSRLHPQTMARIALQLATDRDQAVWQPIEKQALRQEVAFGGLDILMLFDLSISMRTKAQIATDTALCLVEGLQLARYKVAREMGPAYQPDVRTQIIAFGSDSEILSPLSYEPTAQQKGKMYTNLLQPKSTASLVTGSLEHVRQAASTEPARDVIALIISDGDLGDHARAKKAVDALPPSVDVAEFVIGNGRKFISNNHEVVVNPNELPAKLRRVVTDYVKRLRLN